MSLRIGTAGWNVSSGYANLMSHGGSHLERYSTKLNAVEINTSFYRFHQRKTYERWAQSTPADFSFSVKIPKVITHELRLTDYDKLLDRFLDEVAGLGKKLGVLLIQLPPSFSFDMQIADRFFRSLRSGTQCPSVLEPRHASWFVPDVGKWLNDRGVARVAADPAPIPDSGRPGGWDGLTYYRWHGSPQIYHSRYDLAAIFHLKNELDNSRQRNVPTWCIFDNTASGAALGNAIELASLI